MMKRKDDTGLDFGALRLGIERCDPDLLLGFYAEDAQLSIVNAGASQASPFELYGKAEIAKHLRATFGQKALHRVEGEIVGDDRVTFWEACKYPDGSRVWVETTLEVRDGMIVRQVDVVAKDIQAGRQEEIIQRRPTGEIKPRVDELPSGDLP
jgi:SnoaL-like protein